MAKIQLTLSTNYVPTWGAWEGVREVIQNALDAQDDGYEMEVRHSGTDTLRITSKGVKLDANVWLLGQTTKAGGNYRGHFGEGLKLGVMALVRAGHEVKIVNDDESWTPKIEGSETFNGADVLAIYTRSRNTRSYKFTVEIGGINRDTWKMLRERFLFLAKPKRVVSTSRGEVILDEAFKGRLYVKGIYVQTRASLSAGHNFNNVETDRDRKMVDAWDLKYNCARAWEEAMTHGEPKVAEQVISMLEANAPDIEGFCDTYAPLNDKAAKTIAEHFKKEHGEDAIPVANMADSREAGHFGKRGVVVPLPLVRALKDQVGDIDQVRTKFKAATSKTYGWDELTETEQAVYSKAMALVEAAAQDLGYAPVEARTKLVDFNDESLNGTHKGGDIQLAKKLLTSFDETIRVLVHEVAHDQGADGEKSHEVAEGRLFAKIISTLAFAN